MPSDLYKTEEIGLRIAHAQEVYKSKLAVYDKVVLGVFCSLVWRCPAREMRRLYNTSVGRRHLDIGPGTGYFVDKCRFPVADPEIGLLDLSTDCLEMSAQRLARYNPTVYQANLMDPLPVPAAHYDSVAMNLVFHTIPGGWETKGVILKHVAETLRPGGRLFGTTVLNEGVPMNAVTHKLMLVQHERGNFQNQGDDAEGLRAQLAKYFPKYRMRIRGTVAIFQAIAA